MMKTQHVRTTIASIALWLVAAVIMSSTQAQAQSGAPAGIVSWWTGDGTPNDATGANPGTLSGGIGYTAGAVSQAFDLDGNTGHVSIGDPASLRLTTGITIEAWIRPTAGPRASDVLASIVTKWSQKWWDDPDSDSYGLWLIEEGGQLQLFSALHQPGGLEPHINGGNVPLNVWSHVAMTFDSATGAYAIYVNGVSVASFVSPGPLFATSAAVLVGREASGIPRPFTGQLDEVTIYDRALTSAELQSIVNAGAGGKNSIGAPPTVTNLITTITADTTFDSGRKTSLLNKLNSAAASLERGSKQSAAGLLGATENEIRAAVRSRKLSATTGAVWLDAIAAIKTANGLYP